MTNPAGRRLILMSQRRWVRALAATTSGHREATARRSPPNRSQKHARVLRPGEAKNDKVSIATPQGVRPRRHRQRLRKAAHRFAVREAADLVCGERDVMRPFVPAARASDFDLALRHGRGTAISLLAMTLNSLAAFSIASSSSAASTVP